MAALRTTDEHALAARLCQWLFPDDENSEHARWATDRIGRTWGMRLNEAQRRIADLPPRTLDAAVEFAGLTVHPSVGRAVAALVHSWCAYTDEQRHLSHVDPQEDASELSAVLAIADLLSSVAQVSAGLSWTKIHGSMTRISDAYASDHHRLIGQKRVPLQGVLHADPADIADFRALSFGVLLTMRVVPGGQLTREVFAYLREHLAQHERIARTAKDRGTLDPEVFRGVLTSSVPAIAEGVL